MLEKVSNLLRHYWPIILLTIVGAFFRLYHLEPGLQFLGDQGRDALVLKRIIVDHDLTFLGPITSVGGFYLGPLYYYLMAPFLWLSNLNPIGPALATTFIGVITVPAIYFFTQLLFSKSAAIYATFLYALASIPILETRGAWNPNPMPLVVIGLIYSLYQVNYQKKPKWLILTGISLVTALQLHYMIVFLGPFLIWQLILILKDKRNYKHLFLGALAFIVLISPLVLFEIKHNFLNTHGLFYYFSNAGYERFNIWSNIKAIVGRTQESIGMVLGFGKGNTVLRNVASQTLAIYAIVKLIKKSSPEFTLIATWLLSSIVALAFFNGNIYSHYLGFVFPATFMIAGVFLSSFHKKLFVIPVFLLGLFAIYNYPSNPVVTDYPGNLDNLQETVDFIAKDIKDNDHKAANIVLIDETNDYRAMSHRYFFELKEESLILDIDQYPQSDVLYLISPYQQADLLHTPVWEVQATTPQEVTQSWDFPDNSYIYKLE